MDENEYKDLRDHNKAWAYGQQASNEEWLAHILRGYTLIVRNEDNANVFVDDDSRRAIAERTVGKLLPFCNLYMLKEQLAIAEAHKQLAEKQTQIAGRQERIAQRIEQGSDRTMKLTKRITCLTYALVAVGIITFVAVCVQIAIQMHWIGK
jgi:hypothetical protein